MIKLTPRTGRRGLTARQQRFVDEYLVDLNATQAAIRAGYTAKNANVVGPRLLVIVGIQRAIETAMAQRATRVQVDADRVLRELSYIAFFDIRTIFDRDGTLRKVTDLPEEVSRALASMELVREKRTKNSDVTTHEVVLHVKANDKLRALELLGRHLGLWTDKVEHSGKVTVQQHEQEMRAFFGRLSNADLAEWREHEQALEAIRLRYVKAEL